MGWRLRIEHTTRVGYSAPVLTSFNEARMTPLTLPTQVTLEAGVSAGPGVPVWTYNDYWGTYVSVFDLPDPHEDLVIRATATVETEPASGIVSLMRTAGLPARYVSGYLHPDPKASPGTTATGQSHAWVEYWAGSWTPLDPTSGAPVGERHVVVARGRDYADVPPLKGIYHGPPETVMNVTVNVTRLA